MSILTEWWFIVIAAILLILFNPISFILYIIHKYEKENKEWWDEWNKNKDKPL